MARVTGSGRTPFWAELVELTRARVLLFVREPEAIFWVFVFPLVLAGVLGFAFRSKGIEPLRVGLLDGPAREAVAAALAEDPHLAVEPVESAEEGRKRLTRAAVDLLVEPLEGSPRLVYDAQRGEGENARLRVLRALEVAADPQHAVRAEEERVEETGARYIDFLFPGLMGMNLMGTGMWGIGFALADTRRKKLLKRLLVTPMRRGSFFLSFLVARLVFLTLEVAVLGSFGHWVLGVPLRGSALLAALVCLLGAFTFAGIGILTASRARTIEAVSGLMNLVMMPMWLGSGVFFSTERFPDWIQPVLRALPLTALNDALRAVVLDGAGPAGLAAPVAWLVAWTGISFAVALRIFRWE
jgi:ABC-2 type transport system permease protein